MKTRVKKIEDRIRSAADSCGRDPKSVCLVAVSKTKPADMVKQAIDCGVTVFGENYIQEAREKITDLSSFDVSWHFIGHLQTNKAKYAVKLFDLIHTVDSIKLAKELNKQAVKIDKIQEILVQVNTGLETTKSGVVPDKALDLARDISNFSNLRVKGLMSIPPLYNEPDKVAPFFRTLRELQGRIKDENIPNLSMDELSMGMTGDFETAINEGATIVRIGTAIFGHR